MSLFVENSLLIRVSMIGALSSIAFLPGCGGGDKLDVYPTEAILLLDDEPFGPTEIQLVPTEPGGRSVSGSVDEKGMVRFTSYDPGDGAPAGEYRVVVGMTMSAPPRPFPNIYRNMEKSPLKVKVEEKPKNELALAMDSKAGAPVDMKKFDMFGQVYADDAWKAGATMEE